jgi:hypothetical protein
MTDDISKLQKSYDSLYAKYVELSDTIDGFITEINIHDNSIGTNKLVSGLRPIEIVDILPAAGTQGRIVFLTPDSKLYRDTGTAWTVATEGADIVANSITGGQIAAATITADKYSELRNTYVFCGADSLDANYPFALDFEIISEMTAINNVKLSFRISKFRAYETGTPSGGSGTTPSGGSGTSQSTSGYYPGILVTAKTNVTNVGNEHVNGVLPTAVTSPVNFAHSAHTHPTPNHIHTTPDHTHGITYGIYEETTTPTIHYHIDNGAGYGAASGNYTTDQLDIAITASISGTGFKRIKFDSDVRCRIAAWVMCKIDITA